jgi:hypothetical protein
MLLRLFAGRNPFQYLLDQVNAPARTVTFITQYLISRTSGIAKTAVHTGTQNSFGFLCLGSIF